MYKYQMYIKIDLFNILDKLNIIDINIKYNQRYVGH